MLVVRVPDSYINERTYIVQTLMGYLWNLDVEILAENRRDVLIEDPSTYDNKKLHISDILFQFPENQWLKAESLPQPPLKRWNVDIELRGIPLIDYQLPVIYGIESMLESGHSSYLVEDENCLFLGLDIFGSAFFMLTRYEEYVKPDRDMHGRFPAAASLAFQEVFLDRPIINESIEIL
ncbi:MAG: hypothetical protein GYA42_08690, partial [Syntrophomonadaceae bacterium]|nr:hypothetical protein [Syntrophomonadaceae bacterium]